MRVWGRLPSRLRFLAATALLLWGLQAVLRAVFLAAFLPPPASRSPAGALAHAVYLGLKFDLRAALLLCLPVAAGIWLPPLDPRRVAARRGWLAYAVASSVASLLVAAVDLGYYGWLHSRLNATVLEHVEAPAIALQTVWEHYPVVPGILGLALAAAAYGWVSHRAAARALVEPTVPLSRAGRVAATIVFAVLYAAGVYGKWSRYPLRWSDAHAGADRFAAALALHPLLNLFDTYEFRSPDLNEDQVREHYDRIARALGVDHPDPATLDYARIVRPAPRERPLNLVLIHLESWAAFKTGVMGNPLDPTPRFDRIAREGILFTNFFVTRPPTARCVFSVLFGTPDIHVPHSSSNDPLVARQHCVLNALDGYDKMYFIGGSAAWGNIRGILGNVEGIRIYEEGDHEGPADDVWGISDLRLFEEANRVLRARERPFVAFIQTAGNHPPFTIPEYHGGFETVERDPDLLWQNGFDDRNAEFNAIRFLDHSLGRFFDLARGEDYFRDTVFLMYGDHGTNATDAVPWEALRLTYHHVPFVVYAPGLSGGGRVVEENGMLVDVLPTAMGFTGVPYLNTTLGRDLLAERPPGDRFAYVDDSEYQGLIEDGFYLRRDPDAALRLFRHRSERPTQDVAAQEPERVERMSRFLRGLHETSKYLLYHNPPREHPGGR